MPPSGCRKPRCCWMSSWLIALVGMIYAVVAADLYRQGKGDLALMFVGYAIAQAGVWMAATK